MVKRFEREPEKRPYATPGEPGRLDRDGVEWFACDPYPTWFRLDEDGRVIERGLDPHWIGDLEWSAVPWADAQPLPIHVKDPGDCFGHDSHSEACDGIVRPKWSGVACACGARWYCL